MATFPTKNGHSGGLSAHQANTNTASKSGGVNINIETWTEEAIEALRRTEISSHPASFVAPVERGIRGTGVALDIPLDTESLREERRRAASENMPESDDPTVEAAPRPLAYTKCREPSHRDSLKRREALLRGKEGSRRRQKWENDRLLGNPWVEPPSPQDWAPCPTHRVHATVPYFLAPLWDERMMAEAAARSAKEAEKQSRIVHERRSRMGGKDKVSRELRQKIKRAKGAKGLLQDLEEQVRQFVKGWEEKEKEAERRRRKNINDEEEEQKEEMDSEDEEIVFVGRNGAMKDVPESPTTPTMSEDEDEDNFDQFERDKLVFDSLVDDHGASFGRWLVHTIATYYNLRTYSVTIGHPARREAYVAISDGCRSECGGSLPQPLWGMV